MEKVFLFPIVHYWAHFQGMEEHLPFGWLIFLGVLIGFLAGFFGIGGRFLMTPLLNILFNVPYNVIVGSELCQMLGNASLNVMKIRMTENVDYKLALFLLIGAVIGVEGGVQLLEVLKMAKYVTIRSEHLSVMFLVFSAFYAGLLLWIGTTIYLESRMVYRSKIAAESMAAFQMDMTARMQTISFPPLISLPVSGIERISLWIIVGVGFFIGLFVGFLGVGGSFIGLPALVYVLGCPLAVAISTDLFASLFVMGYGVISHSLKGNIDLVFTIVLLTSTVLGTEIGAPLARRFSGSKVRQAFAFAAYLVVLLLIIKFVSFMGLIGIPYF